MTDENRRRLTALVAAGTKLDAAARLVREATIDVARSGLPREAMQQIAAEIAAYGERLTFAIKEIP